MTVADPVEDRPRRRPGGRGKESRRARLAPGTYDGVTDEEIFDRDRWLCQMPVCLHPLSRALYPNDHGDKSTSDPWRATIEHVMRLIDGGADDAANKIAAHHACNAAASDDDSGRRMSYTIGSVPELVALLNKVLGALLNHRPASP